MRFDTAYNMEQQANTDILSQVFKLWNNSLLFTVVLNYRYESINFLAFDTLTAVWGN